MTTVADKVESIVSELKVQREAISVKLNLEHSESKQQWQEMEAKWQQVEEKQTRFSHSVGKSTIALGKDLEQLSAELKAGYATIKLD